MARIARLLRLVIALALACSASACRLPDVLYVSTPPPAPPPAAPAPRPPILDFAEEGHLSGDLGLVEHYDADTTRLESRLGGSGTYVRLDAVGPGWWVMVNIEFLLDPDHLEPGGVYTIRAGLVASTVPGHPDERYLVHVLGCSGPAEGRYTFDGQPTQTVLRVELLPTGLHRVHFECTFGEQVAAGYFDYAPQPDVDEGI